MAKEIKVSAPVPSGPATTEAVSQEGIQSRSTPIQPRPVPRPTPKAQAEDPRAFQIGQLQRRFKAEQSDGDDGCTVLTFNMEPSDPDFPYDIEALVCALSVPASYPANAKPTLLVKNNEIPRGFQINIERGFDQVAAGAPTATLLGLMNRLDKQLETILAGRMTDTIKIVANRNTPKPSTQSKSHDEVTAAVPEVQKGAHYSEGDLAVAQQHRQSHVRQLEARFSRIPLFARSADGMTYTIPLETPKRAGWPAALQSIRSVKILVPRLYPLEPATLHLENESVEARGVEKAFRTRAMDHSGNTLTQHLNYLSQNMKEMSTVTPEKMQAAPQQAAGERAAASHSTISSDEPAPKTEELGDSERGTHIHYVSRPPEWDGPGTSDDSEGEDNSTSESDDAEEDADANDGESPEAAAFSAPAERGILLSFPHLELHGIELLELTSLQITVKCERCKDTMDISRLRSSENNGKMREESCKKCAAGFALRFRADMIHVNSVRAGYLDLEGCSVVDMLPSNFIPACAECSTTLPAPGVVAVRGDSALAICRECHRKMSFRISEVKFLQISASNTGASLAPGRKKARENLGITAGTALPQEGRCQHYRKSYRWFRFSCCNKVFACDRCHDEKEDHPNEWANRMLCGYCSREQNFRPDNCGVCHASLTGRRGRGFWEGGKGTRDPARMSRKDPRKYKRRPGTKQPA